MSEQKNYNISFRLNNKQLAESHSSVYPWSGDTWQEACHKWIALVMKQHEVLLEIPSEDGRSGIMEIKELRQDGWERHVLVWQVTVTIID